jgi:hypothetical protein
MLGFSFIDFYLKKDVEIHRFNWPYDWENVRIVKMWSLSGNYEMYHQAKGQKWPPEQNASIVNFAILTIGHVLGIVHFSTWPYYLRLRLELFAVDTTLFLPGCSLKCRNMWPLWKESQEHQPDGQELDLWYQWPLQFHRRPDWHKRTSVSTCFLISSSNQQGEPTTHMMHNFLALAGSMIPFMLSCHMTVSG